MWEVSVLHPSLTLVDFHKICYGIKYAFGFLNLQFWSFKTWEVWSSSNVLFLSSHASQRQDLLQVQANERHLTTTFTLHGSVKLRLMKERVWKLCFLLRFPWQTQPRCFHYLPPVNMFRYWSLTASAPQLRSGLHPLLYWLYRDDFLELVSTSFDAYAIWVSFV